MSEILVVNAGSTSLKLHVVDEREEAVALESFADTPTGIAAVAHRVVHGGARFVDPVLIDATVRKQISELIALAPLHNAPAFDALESAQKAYPGVPHIAVFDTAFHRTLSDEAAVYPLPAHWRGEWGIRRFGFHGLSVEWCTSRAPEIAGGTVDRLVVCHLGGGSSITAVVDGRSVDTTMGFTPLEGVPMTTRSGSIDPGAILYVLRNHALDADALDHVLNFESGLKGLAGGSGEMLELEQRVAQGDRAAALAVDVFVHRLAGAVAAMAASASGIDALAFTAGIGEHSALVRERLCGRLAFLGVEMDGRKNAEAEPDCDVSVAGSAVRILVVRAREELIAARAARRLLASGPRS
ncbi:MAG TPA: acetate/propionate family kinase [Gaiellaceae bacterium]